MLENLAVRATGEILATTTASGPDIWMLDPVANSPATLVYSFTGYSSVLGIAEMHPNQFYVVAGNLSFSPIVGITPVTGSWSVFHVNLTQFDANGAVTALKIADFPDAVFLNGLCVLSLEQGLVYIADAYAGVINILNVNTGDHHVAINNSLTAVEPPSTNIAGVNGVHVQETNGTLYLYFSNTAQNLLARMPINTDGTPGGDPEVFVPGLFLLDDFTFDSTGDNIFQALIGSNEVVKIDVATREVTLIAGNPDSAELMSVTSVQFGRLSNDSDTVFVTLNGANFTDLTITVPGAVKMLDLGVLA
ncbi:hypothetical protein BDP27DRAFT_88458 [Rhodocollybia butyracea]|uniref:Uncharacterized protein n=1 Tax=Rhodocollybia butyracea TaxID=206335 RepID=A0A9P5Q757_9AGAR|nr:hypothetical protein BDP27DRAFT_88458 [Rhodocollybia butyracea]